MTGATALQQAAWCGAINHDLRQRFLASSDPKWKTSRFRLATGMIDAAISGEGTTFFGAYFGAVTRFAVLDIDENSRCHSA